MRSTRHAKVLLEELYDDRKTVFRQLSQQEARRCAEQDIDEYENDCTLFLYAKDGYAALLVAQKDYPVDGCMLVKSIYLKEHSSDEKWSKFGYEALHIAEDSDLVLKTVYYALMKANDNAQHLYIVSKSSGPQLKRLFKPCIDYSSLSKLYAYAKGQIEWNTSQPESQLDGTDYKVNGIQANDFDSDMFISWQQFIDAADVKQSLMKFVNNIVKSSAQKSYQCSIHDRGYFWMWQRQPGNSIDDICSQLAQKIDQKVLEVYGSFAKFASAAFEMVKPTQDDSSSEVPKRPDENFSEVLRRTRFCMLVDRASWWRLIPDQTYKAIISRSAAVHQGKMSRGVSLKVLRQCLDDMCYDLSVLYAQSRQFTIEKIFKQSKAVNSLDMLPEMHRDYAKSMTLVCCGSFVDRKNIDDYDDGSIDDYDAIVSNSDQSQTYNKLFKSLNSVSWNEDDEAKLIATISKTVDITHDRGSLAGVFIEGGSKTCDQVSNLKLDEIYESSHAQRYGLDMSRKCLSLWRQLNTNA